MTPSQDRRKNWGLRDIVIISGLSGSGKSLATRCFEDMGYFCVDNLPAQLIPVFADLCAKSDTIRKAALVIDVREGAFLKHFPETFAKLRQGDHHTTLLFLEASDEALIRRFSESRRPHPLAADQPLESGIRKERQVLQGLKALADIVVDTSRYNVHELKKYLYDNFQDKATGTAMVISLVSFGYKYGIPEESDFLFDTRFIQNPFFVDSLKPLTGLDPEVQAFLHTQPEYGEFLRKIGEMLLFLLPRCRREGKTYLTISIGCTGGRHRSVAMAQELSDLLTSQGYSIKTLHRDLEKE
ncbi:MAG TPA: RNase adapter RapZ [Candidatus Polarisedimenticolia bacterium]|nr:RNase adapter RapZ [Candidatus Polarisedimenticolia bacterium]